MKEREGAGASYVIRQPTPSKVTLHSIRKPNTLCSPIKITSWNENNGGRNTLDLLYRKTRWWSSHLWGAIPKQPAITKQTLKDVSNKYESIFFIPRPLVNFHINRGDFLLKIRDGPWTGSMHRVHGVVHGPRSMFCIRPMQTECHGESSDLHSIFRLCALCYSILI